VNHELVEAPCNAASPDGVRMAIGAGACSSPGWERLYKPHSRWARGVSGHPVGVLVGQCQHRSEPLLPLSDKCGDPCPFLGMTCTLGYPKGHFKCQGMGFGGTSRYRTGATPCQQAAAVFLLPCLSLITRATARVQGQLLPQLCFHAWSPVLRISQTLK